jgi:signal peptidase II
MLVLIHSALSLSSIHPSRVLSITEPPRIMTNKPNALVWLWLSAVVIALDQLSKMWVQSALPVGLPHSVIPGVLNWTLTFNRGAAFSFLTEAGGWQRWFFVALALVISSMLVVWLARTPRHDWRTGMPLAMIIGGAVGNLIDRLHAAQVTDFIQVYFRQWSYPVFNLADCGISVGAVMLIAFGLFADKAAGKPAGSVR